MKKLMIAAAIVCAAALSQAAQVTWKLAFNSTYSGMQLYAVNSDALSGKDLTKLALTDVTGNSFDWYVNATDPSLASTLLYTKSGKSTGTQTTTIGLSETDKNVMFVIVDGDKYAIAGDPINTADKQYTPPSTGSTLSFTNTGTLTFNNFQSVPEPTSAMLLLLGVAGLALRRRRA